MENAIKIKSYKVRRDGLRGMVISLPKVWAEDQQLKAGDRIDIYRNTEDQLIIVCSKNGK